MAVKQNHEAMLKQLKKHLKVLQRREEQAKNKLGAALKQIRHLVDKQKSTLKTKMRVMKAKIAKAESSGYAKAILHLERELVKGIEAKGKALLATLETVEKKHVADLKKNMTKKVKPASSKTKETRVKI